jgi:uncharacterized protein YbaA (DUF1428 family)
MKVPHIATMMDSKAMPFDGKRMVYGGFNVLVDLRSARSSRVSRSSG